MYKTKVLAFVDNYLPGYKFGGPGRVLANMVEMLGDEYEFRIVTRDRDLGDDVPYEGVQPNAWMEVGKGLVQYVPENEMSLGFLARLMRSTEHDVAYLNSAFSPLLTLKLLLLRKLRLVPLASMVVAPRGEFSPGALAIKAAKKRAFIGVARLGGLYDGVKWQALSQYEDEEIRACFGRDVSVRLARDLVTIGPSNGHNPPRAEKVPGVVRAVFISRVSRKKNLDGALKILQRCDCNVVFDIYGPIEDQEYWRSCEKLIARLPANVQANYHGGATYEEVYGLLRNHDLFFLPTHSEGSATAVLEALVAGCPVLISDNTPYRDMQSIKAGWDIQLDQPERFLQALRQCAEMDQSTYREWSDAAEAYGLESSRGEKIVQESRDLFKRGSEE